MSDSNVKQENGIVLFTNPEFGSVRGFMRNGEPWFVAMDVAIALGYGNPSRSVQDHCKYAELLKTTSGVGLEIPPRGLLVIPESDVYALIFRSNLPKAEEFRRWVCEEVLPSIRKTGSYSMQPTLPDFSNPAEAARAWADEYEKRVAAQKVIEEQAATIEAQEIALGDNRDWKAVTAIPWLRDVFADTSTKACSRIGKALTALSRHLGMEIRKAEDDRWGTVNVYHTAVIEYFRKRLLEDRTILADIRR